MRPRTIVLTLIATAVLALPGVFAQLTITTQPTDQSVSLSANVQFKVVARSSGGGVTYRWWFKDAALDPALNASAARSTLSLSRVTEAMDGLYWVVVSDSNGSVTSRVARLEVDPQFTKVTQGPLVTDNADDRAVAWGDFDNDGDPDVVVANGYWWDDAWGELPSLNTLYLNQGNATFRRATTPPSGPAYGWCINGADADNDGDIDLWLGVKETVAPQYFSNKGGATFTRILAEPSWIENGVRVRGGMQAWGDYDGDGLVDLVVVPLGYDAAHTAPIALLHNSGNGRFAAVTNSPLYAARKRSSSVSWVDLDEDGDLDLVCLGAPPLAFRNDQGVLYPTDLPMLPGANVDAWADFDNDGDPDVLGTYQNGTPILFRNEGSGRWTALEGPLYAALQGVGPYTEATGAAWGDYDNDGDLDLFVTTGVSDLRPTGQASRNHLFRNDGAGGWVEWLSGSPVNDQANSWRCVWVDVDSDGDLDLHVVNASNSVVTTANDFLYLNNGTTNAWLEVQLTGEISNRSAIGAKVRVRAIIAGKEVWQLRTLAAQAWTQQWVAHFGLGDATKAETLRIEWPSGIVQEFRDVAGNRIVNVQEPALVGSANAELVGPSRYEVAKGAGVTLQAGAVAPGVTHQWTFNGQDIPGAQGHTLALTGFAVPQIGEYAVVMTGLSDAGLGAYEGRMRPMRLAMKGRPVVTDPTANPGPSVSLGARVEIAVWVTGTEAFTCQWQKAGRDIPPEQNATATNLTLVLDPVVQTDEGDYRILVSSAVDTVSSASVSLRVDPTFTKVTQGPIVNDRLSTWYGWWGDYDRDGRLDVFVTGWSGQWRLYHNDGGAMFSTVTNEVMGEYNLRDLWGIWADPDNDDDLDLFALVTDGMSTGGASVMNMFWNDGGGHFTRMPVNGWGGASSGGAWGDYDQDGFIDAFFGTWEQQGPNALLHNNGDGTLTRVTNSILNIRHDAVQLSCAVDFDNDGDLDLVPVRWGVQPTRFYRNDGHGTFAEATPEPIRSELTYSLSAAWGDFDNDGDLDVIFGGWDGTRERFYINNGDGTFTRWAGQPARFEPPGLGGPWVAWGDFDNDGYLDLAVVKYELPIRLWRNRGDGSFAQVLTGSLVNESGSPNQSGCWVDFNQDGNLDFFVATINGFTDKLYMGNGNGNHWLEVKPKGTVSNRQAVGTKIFATANIRGQVMRQMRVITASDSDETFIAHFGLGDATKAEVLRIEWPSGIVQELTNVAANQVLTVTEPPRLESLGEGRIRILCWKHQNYEIEVSDDLEQWTSLGVVATDVNRPEVIDPGAADRPHRFYRAVGR